MLTNNFVVSIKSFHPLENFRINGHIYILWVCSTWPDQNINFFLPVCMVIEIADKSGMHVTLFSQRVRKCLCELRCLCRPDLAPKKGQNKAFPFPLPVPPGKITFSSVPGWMYPEPFQILELVRILGGEQMASEIQKKKILDFGKSKN